ncbi:MAG: hypothetical protein KDK37_18845 [Leptospiraceae bacterium]|nr:hypothetical protein [Leptospiraceae bacterium]
MPDHMTGVTRSFYLLCTTMVLILPACWGDQAAENNRETQDFLILNEILLPNLESGVCPPIEQVPEIQPGGYLQNITVGDTFYFTFPLINRNNHNDSSQEYQISFSENVGQDVRPLIVKCLLPYSSAYRVFQNDSGFSGQNETVESLIINAVPATSGFGRSIVLFRGVSGTGTINIQVPSSAL